MRKLGFVIAATCLVLVVNHDSSDAESWRGVGLGAKEEDTKLSCPAGGCSV